MPKISTTSIKIFDRVVYFIGFYSILAGISAFIIAGSIHLSSFQDSYPRIWLSIVTLLLTIVLGYLLVRLSFLVPIAVNVAVLFFVFLWVENISLFVEDISLFDLPEWEAFTILSVVGLLFGGLISQPRVIYYQSVKSTETNHKIIGTGVDALANLFGVPTFGIGAGIGRAIYNANSRNIVNENDSFTWTFGEFILPTNICTAIGILLSIWFYPSVFGLVLFSSIGAMLGLVIGNIIQIQKSATAERNGKIIQQLGTEETMQNVKYPISLSSTFLRGILIIVLIAACCWLSTKQINLTIR